MHFWYQQDKIKFMLRIHNTILCSLPCMSLEGLTTFLLLLDSSVSIFSSLRGFWLPLISCRRTACEAWRAAARSLSSSSLHTTTGSQYSESSFYCNKKNYDQPDLPIIPPASYILWCTRCSSSCRPCLSVEAIYLLIVLSTHQTLTSHSKLIKSSS